MSDTIDDMPVKREHEPKYKKCTHCGTYSANSGVCPFCGKGVLK